RETCLVGRGRLRRIRGLAEELMLESHEWIDLMGTERKPKAAHPSSSRRVHPHACPDLGFDLNTATGKVAKSSPIGNSEPSARNSSPVITLRQRAAGNRKLMPAHIRGEGSSSAPSVSPRRRDTMTTSASFPSER